MSNYLKYSVVRYKGDSLWFVVGCECGTRFHYDHYHDFDSAFKMAKALNCGRDPEVTDHAA